MNVFITHSAEVIQNLGRLAGNRIRNKTIFIQQKKIMKKKTGHPEF